MLVPAWLCFIFCFIVMFVFINLLIQIASDAVDPERAALLLILWASGVTTILLMKCLMQ